MSRFSGSSKEPRCHAGAWKTSRSLTYCWCYRFKKVVVAASRPVPRPILGCANGLNYTYSQPWPGLERGREMEDSQINPRNGMRETGGRVRHSMLTAAIRMLCPKSAYSSGRCFKVSWTKWSHRPGSWVCCRAALGKVRQSEMSFSI